VGWIKLYEYIQIAFWSEAIPKCGAEKRQFPNMVPLAEFFYSLLGDLDMCSFCHNYTSILSRKL